MMLRLTFRLLLALVSIWGASSVVVAQEATPVAVAPEASPVATPLAVSEIVPVVAFTIDRGDCMRPTGIVEHELSGNGYRDAGPGTLAPWGGGDEPAGALGVPPVQYGEGILDDFNLGELLDGRTTSVVVRDGATGDVLACGEIGGVVQKAGYFWQHDRLIVGVRPVAGSGISGIATFTEDTGVLSDKINVSVALVAEGDWAPFPAATPAAE